jgi:pimeloyl-ACP methyl ester carboxylesterase
VGELSIKRDGVRLAGQEGGEGPAVVLLHGLTASRRYVVMGSTALERSGHRVIAYDARGHGASSPAPAPELYTYDELGRDLIAVLDATGVQRAVLAGASMGAHTLLWLALNHPDRVAGLVVITPAYGGNETEDPERLERWDALSEGLRSGGIDGFVRAYGEPQVPEQWRETVIKVIRQRLAVHEHLDAVADALQAVPRSHPFASLAELKRVSAPTTVVASNDEADPGHPQAVGEAYAELIPGAELITDRPGNSPVAWQGSQLSRVIAAVVARSEA